MCVSRESLLLVRLYPPLLLCIKRGLAHLNEKPFEDFDGEAFDVFPSLQLKLKLEKASAIPSHKGLSITAQFVICFEKAD